MPIQVENGEWALKVLKLAGLAEPDDTSTTTGSSNTIMQLSFPEADDVKVTLARLYASNTFNCARPLEHNLVMRAVIRNTGSSDKGPNTTADVSLDEFDPLEAIKFPSPADIFDKVWGLVPDFLKTRITQWAQDGKDQQIAREITSYVKTALGLLPIPVPKLLVNAVANLVIPPLVSFIINKLAKKSLGVKSVITSHFRATHDVTPETLRLTKDLDRRILQSAGIPAADLPAHLVTEAWEEPPTKIGHISCLGQPLDRDVSVDLKQFYDEDNRNGCKPMALTQVVAAQITMCPASDEALNTFAPKVWATLSDSQKSQLTSLAKESPPNKAKMVDPLYQPTCDLLVKEPYLVPRPIQATFASMKVPEVIDWIIATR